MTSPLSGTPIDLSFGHYTASIASIGASLRTLRFDDRDLVVPYGIDEFRPANRGAILAPWPNRIVDGQYPAAGKTQKLPLTEPARHHALHGLVGWLDFRVLDRSDNRVRLGATVVAQLGYPFRLDVTVDYELNDSGLHTTVTAVNTGPDAAPFGTAPHPYLVAGDGRVDDWTLTLPADRVLTVTEDRLIPIGLADVESEAGGTFDFRRPRAIRNTFIDHAFTDLARDSSGGTEVRVTAPSGTGVAVRFGAECPWVQVHTADQPVPAINRLGLAVEPMTCPPDAFNSGTDLIHIEPGASASASWTIVAL